MSYTYFDLDTARRILPWVKEKLEQLRQAEIKAEQALLAGKKEYIEIYSMEVDSVIRELTDKGILVRDVKMGLVDFPAVINDRPAYLCWKIDEEDILYWHYVEEGFRGRKRITKRENILSYQ
ncbi:DUF2203 domain-containing protein [Metallosphaera hakonensis]|uniref:DUF2203 domain-containing protein n=1 Tax=Metallosphaera hakonensis JCM 8857 = DSM 7519 TaxID=1293036 RepID=A0A2U9IRU0_9CREN|nr:DUF2203 domain-containing protein [Metallosphaera hakonensis]AWR98761.1 DUF2203 family protein [Metallosphaera hakonensis JCM 8857 = DSM 7519]